MPTEVPRVIEAIEDLPEPLREPLKDAYVPARDDSPDRGKLILAGSDPNISRLQGALVNERGTSTTRQSKIQELENKLAELQRSNGGGPAKESGKSDGAGKLTEDEFQARLERLEETYKQRVLDIEEKMKAEQLKAAQAEERQQSLELDQQLESIMLEKGASKKTAALGRRLMREQIAKTESGFQVVDDKGTVRLGELKSVTRPMTFDELAIHVLNDNKFLLAGNTVGSGAGGGNNSTTNNGSVITMTEAESKDPRIYRAKKEEAKKSGAELVIQG